jgi:hypothetical protein
LGWFGIAIVTYIAAAIGFVILYALARKRIYPGVGRAWRPPFGGRYDGAFVK